MSANSGKNKKTKERDERVRIPLDPEEALRGLLKVEPAADDRPKRNNPQIAARDPEKD